MTLCIVIAISYKEVIRHNNETLVYPPFSYKGKVRTQSNDSIYNNEIKPIPTENTRHPTGDSLFYMS